MIAELISMSGIVDAQAAGTRRSTHVLEEAQAIRFLHCEPPAPDRTIRITFRLTCWLAPIEQAKKLKQESRLESLALLAKHALPAHLPGSLKSTSTLGQNPTAPLSAQEMAAKKEDLNVRRALDRQGSKGVGMYDEEESEGEEEDAAAVPGSERDKVRMAQAEKRRTRHGLVEDMKEEAPRTVVVQSTINTSAKKHRSGGKVRDCGLFTLLVSDDSHR